MRKDLLFEDDILTADGDFLVGESDEQHIQHVLISSPGHYKQSPLIGADITKMLGGSFGAAEKRAVKIALQADGYILNHINYINGEIIIDAE